MPSGIYKRKPRSKEHCFNLRLANFKGDAVGYSGIHDWVQYWRGYPTTCEGCGKTGLKGQKIHWANRDHKYSRVLDDYIRLCAKCHGEYDKKFNLRKRSKSLKESNNNK
jgi:hypothetical protein